ncbi:TonB-dependent receptor [Ferruginibacter yonginensis]|uniref:TonB-dependent receptor n=1 Tax=Ferruginibacter yonginensis TaxID=1310416 RepID=A0ABV8QVH1_9BACT
MKKLLTLVMLLQAIVAFANNGVVKGSFSGTVTDAATGKPIVGATVYINDAKVGTNTNANGNFLIDNITEGNHLIEFSHIGYNTLAQNIFIKGDTKLNISLSAAVVENNAVIVTGVSRASQLKKVPFQVAVMRKEELQQTTSTNIIDAITRKAGVSAIATGPAISKPVIRGLGYNRVLTMNDGVRQEGQQWGDEHGIEIDEASVSKIEILKGPASLVYGSDAMAGVVNIITNVPVALNTLKANVGSNYQTNNRLRSLYGNVAGNKNGFSWNVYGTTREAADYKNKYDGYVFNSKFKEQNAGGYVGYNGNWGYSHLIVSNFSLTPGLVEGERNDQGKFIKPLPGGNEGEATDADFKSTIAQVPFQQIQHFKIATDNSFKIGDNKLTLNVGYQRNQREEFGNPDDLKEKALYFDLKTTTYAAQFHLKEKGGWKPSIGINGMNQTNTNRGIEQLIPNYRLNDMGVFVFTEKDFDKLTLSGGARFDNRNIDVANLLDETGSIKGNSFKKDFNNFSGSAGLAYQASKKVNIKFNVARAFRAPSIPELASNGAHEGTIRYEYGDASLKSETSTQFDAAVDFNTQHVSFNVAGYINAFNNFIFYRKLSANDGTDSLVNVDGNDLTAFKFDQRKASLAGIEATLDFHPHPIDWLHFQNTFSYVAGRLREAEAGSKNLPFIPAPRLLTELRGDFKKVGKGLSNLYVKVELDNTFKQNNPFTAFNTETATNGYTLLNAGVGTDVVNKKGTTLCTVNFSANNLGDVAYQNHLSRLKYAAENVVTGRTGVFNMGRNFSVKVNVPLSMKL